MDTPKSSKLAATSTAEAVPAQESPVFSFISNLSPIQPLKAPPVTHGFPGLNSPPLVFTSPRVNPRNKLTSLKRAYPRESVHAIENQEVQLATREVTCDEKGSHSHTSIDDHIESPEECPDQFLCDVVNTGSVDRNILNDLSAKELVNVDHPPETVAGSNESNAKHNYKNKSSIIDDQIVVPHPMVKEIGHESESKTPIDMSMIESDIKLENDGISLASDLKIDSEFPVDNALRDQGHESRNECFEVRQNGPLDQSSNLLSGSMQTEKDKDIYVECTEPVLSKSVLQDVQNGPEV